MSSRIEGVQVSSYWPERTAQIKAARNAPAKAKLRGIKRKMTLIILQFAGPASLSSRRRMPPR